MKAVYVALAVALVSVVVAFSGRRGVHCPGAFHR
jgi:hypothetical protein